MIIFASVRVEIASFLQALILVYSIMIFGWVVQSWVLSSGMSPGRLIPVFKFLDGVVGPFMAFLRRFIPPLGPVDLSPLVALLVVQLGGGTVAQLIGG
jgi:YggT family protein